MAFYVSQMATFLVGKIFGSQRVLLRWGEHTLLGTWKRQTSGSQPPILGGNFLGSPFQGSSVSCETVHGLCQNFVRQERLLPSPSRSPLPRPPSLIQVSSPPAIIHTETYDFQLLKRCCCPFKGQKHRELLRQPSTVLQNDTRSTLCFGGTRVTAFRSSETKKTYLAHEILMLLCHQSCGDI